MIDDLFAMTLHRFVPRYYLPATLAHFPQAAGDLDRPLWDRIGLGTFVLASDRPRICPRCWAERPVVVLPWWLRHITVCPAHQVLLTDRCAHCQGPLRVDIARGCCARCEADLASLPAVAVVDHADSLMVTRVLWEAIGCAEALAALGRLDVAPEHPVRALIPPALLHFFWDFGQLLLTRAAHSPLFEPAPWVEGTPWARPHAQMRELRMRELNVVALHEVLTAVWRALDDWPVRWETTLEWLAEQERRAQIQPRDGVLHLLFTRLADSAFDIPRTSWDTFLATGRAGEAGAQHWVRHWRQLRSAAPEVDPAHAALAPLTQEEVARRLGVSVATVRQFQLDGTLRLAVAPHGRTSIEQTISDSYKHMTLQHLLACGYRYSCNAT